MKRSFCKFFFLILVCLLFLEGTANAFRDSSGLEVNESIVIQPMIFIRGHSDDAKKSREILERHPLLQGSAIYDRIKSYLQPTLPKDVQEHVKFYRWLHTDDWNWPVDKTTLIIEVDYTVTSLKIQDKEMPVGSITFRAKYPLFSEEAPNELAYKTGWQWWPQIIFPISDDPRVLDVQLNKAVKDLFGNYGTSLVWKPSNQVKGVKQ